VSYPLNDKIKRGYYTVFFDFSPLFVFIFPLKTGNLYTERSFGILLSMHNDQSYAKKLAEFYRKNKRMPSYGEAARIFSLRSKDSAHGVIGRLVKLGLISKDKTGRMIPKEALFQKGPLRVLGLVEAGFPTPGEENLLDTLTLDDFLIGNRDASFMLKVKGDSMNDAGIKEGDLVIVERVETAKPGSIVIAEVDGAWTMKYLRTSRGKFYLEPANKEYKPIYPKEDLRIAAVVTAVVRKYRP
jgi:SOS regulatory protein LexA